MLSKNKQLIIGILIGIIFASTAAFGADVIRNSYFNSDLKLAINGKPVQDLRIVTVELEGEQYGRNYYSIADLVKALNDFGGVVAKVDFDANTKTTVIDIEQKTVYITPMPKNSLQREGDVTMNEVPLNKYGHPDFSNVVPNERPKIETDGTYYYFTYNDTKYILVSGGSNEPQLKLPEPYRFEIPIIDGKIHFGIQLIKSDETGREVIIDDIPYAWYYRASSYCIPYDYYVNTIIPIVNKGAE